MSDYDYLPVSNGSGDSALMHVNAARIVGATTLTVDSITNVPAKFIATSGELLPSGFIDPATVTNFKGHTSGSSLVIDSFEPGSTDVGNSVGQVVVIKPNTGWANRVAQFIKNATNTGTPENVFFSAITAVSATLSAALQAASLHITGNSVFDGGISGNGYTLKTIKTPSGFSVYRSAASTAGTGANKLMVFDTVDRDTNSNYSTSTGLFTATADGWHHFDAVVQFESPVAGTVLIVSLALNSTTAEYERLAEDVAASSGQNHTMGSGLDIYLSVGDTVAILARADGCNMGTARIVMHFSGHYLNAG